MLKLAPLDDGVPGYITVTPAEVWSVSTPIADDPNDVPPTPPQVTTRVFWKVHSRSLDRVCGPSRRQSECCDYRARCRGAETHAYGTSGHGPLPRSSAFVRRPVCRTDNHSASPLLRTSGGWIPGTLNPAPISLAGHSGSSYRSMSAGRYGGSSNVAGNPGADHTCQPTGTLAGAPTGLTTRETPIEHMRYRFPARPDLSASSGGRGRARQAKRRVCDGRACWKYPCERAERRRR